MIQNPGSFMAPTGQPGMGSSLQRLLALRNQGASPSPMNGNSINPQAVPPAQPSNVSAIPARVPQLQQPLPTSAPQGAQSPMAPSFSQAAGTEGGNMSTPPSELSIALQALSQFIKSHSLAHEARNGVATEKARAKAIEAQLSQQQMGGQ